MLSLRFNHFHFQAEDFHYEKWKSWISLSPNQRPVLYSVEGIGNGNGSVEPEWDYAASEDVDTSRSRPGI